MGATRVSETFEESSAASSSLRYVHTYNPTYIPQVMYLSLNLMASAYNRILQQGHITAYQVCHET